jgi:PadR family transcriptional regulator, regulatory protein PadR
MPNLQKDTESKLTKSLLDFIVLQLLNTQPMHGYQLITRIRKTFGISFAPSTVYPLLNMLEKKGFVKSEWNMDTEKPRKVYHVTEEGIDILRFTENSLNLISKKLGKHLSVYQDLTVEPAGTLNQHFENGLRPPR